MRARGVIGLLAALVAGCGSSSPGATGGAVTDDGSAAVVDGAADTSNHLGATDGQAAVGDGAPDQGSSSLLDGSSGDGGLVPLALVDGGPTGTFTGTLVFSAVSDPDAGVSGPQQLYTVDLGSPSLTVTPLAVTPGRDAFEPSFSQDGQSLFFNSVDGDPSSATYGYATLMKAKRNATSGVAITTRANGPWYSALGFAGDYFKFAGLGADHDTWSLLVTRANYSIVAAPSAGGSFTMPWSFLPSAPCSVEWMSVSPDGTQVAFILDFQTCGDAIAGLYVRRVDATSLGTPITPYTGMSTHARIVQFNRAGDRVYFIGHDNSLNSDVLMSERLDGTDVQVVATMGLFDNVVGFTSGALVVNDGYFLFGNTAAGINVIPFLGRTAPTTFFASTSRFVSAMTWAP